MTNVTTKAIISRIKRIKAAVWNTNGEEYTHLPRGFNFILVIK